MYNKFMQTFYRLDEGGYKIGAVDVSVPDEPTEEHTGEVDQSTEVSVKPKTRREHFLDKIGGGTGIPGVSPKTREEVLLNNAASNKGGSGGAMVVHLDEETHQLDKTWQEIHDAAAVGQDVRLVLVTAAGVVPCNLAWAIHVEGANVEYPYLVAFYIINNNNEISSDSYGCDAADGYPERVI